MSDERFSLKDHLFNAASISDLAAEYRVLPGFDAEAFQKAVLSGFPERGLLERLEWIADCLEPHLPKDFPEMAALLEAAMPAPLDPARTDDDFGRFIHSVPGILAVRHGLDAHADRALDLIHAATQRFSMEFYVRPFLNTWPELTLTRMERWAEDDNYHVRRLVSEGTRPRLPWAKAVRLEPDQTLPLLDRLHADPTRYVTRSVANHLNDLTRIVPDDVIARLQAWQGAARQNAREMGWMTRHALRTQIKAGDPAALRLLGFDPDATLQASITVSPAQVRMGEAVEISARILSDSDVPVLVDYVVVFPTASGKDRTKTFKLKQGRARAGTALVMSKTHRLKGDATTFKLVPGRHRVRLQVNGRIRDESGFDLTV